MAKPSPFTIITRDYWRILFTVLLAILIILSAAILAFPHVLNSSRAQFVVNMLYAFIFGSLLFAMFPVEVKFQSKLLTNGSKISGPLAIFCILLPVINRMTPPECPAPKTCVYSVRGNLPEGVEWKEVQVESDFDLVGDEKYLPKQFSKTSTPPGVFIEFFDNQNEVELIFRKNIGNKRKVRIRFKKLTEDHSFGLEL